MSKRVSNRDILQQLSFSRIEHGSTKTNSTHNQPDGRCSTSFLLHHEFIFLGFTWKIQPTSCRFLETIRSRISTAPDFIKNPMQPALSGRECCRAISSVRKTGGWRFSSGWCEITRSHGLVQNYYCR